MTSRLNIDIPHSTATVTVKALDIAPHSICPSASIIHPVPPGLETLNVPVYAFYISHPSLGRRMMFDLGIRKDKEGLPPAIRHYFESGIASMPVDKDVVEQLEEGGVSAASVDTVIWGHAHVDHIGDMSRFPSTTNLIIGPGTSRATYPSVPEATLLESNFGPSDRKITELSFDDTTLSIGGFEAIDFLNDGSLYLLNAPGHCPGHILALACVTPTSFVLLGGDSCHHIAQLRPTALLRDRYPCPANLATKLAPSGCSQRTPFLEIPTHAHSGHSDPNVAKQTLAKLQNFDANKDTLLVLAHDASFEGLVNFKLFPESLNNWKEDGLKESVMWRFLEGWKE